MKKIIQFFICFILFTSIVKSQELPLRGICAHRGASETHPENTLAAITEAVNLGAHMIEFDVRATKDNELVIIHDATVDRTTNGKGKIDQLTLAEIKLLDAGGWKDVKFKGEKIPTFEEVLQIIPKNIWMNIHIKGGVLAAEKVARIITESGCIFNSIIACGDEEMKAVKMINPKIKICYMERGNSTDDYVKGAIEVKANSIQLTAEAFSDITNYVSTLKKHGISVNYYYAKSKDELKTLLEAGVDFPLVNDVKDMLQEAAIFGIELNKK
ncbi:MAG: glycerophosphodiester phosphodiesterase family protein [Ignavibacteriales bacterium]|nr:glycerophosphodiester phosphodiesterase family protein [Ignavibacteriales bacterium]